MRPGAGRPCVPPRTCIYWRPWLHSLASLLHLSLASADGHTSIQENEAYILDDCKEQAHLRPALGPPSLKQISRKCIQGMHARRLTVRPCAVQGGGGGGEAACRVQSGFREGGEEGEPPCVPFSRPTRRPSRVTQCAGALPRFLLTLCLLFTQIQVRAAVMMQSWLRGIAERAWFSEMKGKGQLPGQVRERLAREAEEEIEEARRREEQQRIDHERMRVEREKRKAEAAAQAILDRYSQHPHSSNRPTSSSLVQSSYIILTHPIVPHHPHASNQLLVSHSCHSIYTFTCIVYVCIICGCISQALAESTCGAIVSGRGGRGRSKSGVPGLRGRRLRRRRLEEGRRLPTGRRSRGLQQRRGSSGRWQKRENGQLRAR
jgi:hypothetical protein